jgi:hypothetical protein
VEGLGFRACYAGVLTLLGAAIGQQLDVYCCIAQSLKTAKVALETAIRGFVISGVSEMNQTECVALIRSFQLKKHFYFLAQGSG